MNGYQQTAEHFIQSARGVISTTQILKTAISGGDKSDIEYAAGILNTAADAYAGNTRSYSSYGFDGIKESPKAAASQSQLPDFLGDLLAGTLSDIEMANLLVVSGRVADPVGIPLPAEELDRAIERSNQFITLIEHSQPGTPQAAPMRFAFDGIAPPEPVKASPDLKQSKAQFKARFAEVLAALITGTKEVLNASFDAVTDWDSEQIAEAIKSLGHEVTQLPAVGRLISKGISLAVQAFEKLKKLLRVESLESLREKAKLILEKLKAGETLVDGFLKMSYGSAAIEGEVNALLEKYDADSTMVDKGAKELAALQTRFGEHAAMVTRIVKGLDLGRKLLGNLLPKPTGILLFGGFYIATMVYIVLAGMDFADNSVFPNYVEGVRQVSLTALA